MIPVPHTFHWFECSADQRLSYVTTLIAGFQACMNANPKEAAPNRATFGFMITYTGMF